MPSLALRNNVSVALSECDVYATFPAQAFIKFLAPW